MSEQEFLSFFAEVLDVDSSTLDMETEFRYLDEWSSLTGLDIMMRLKSKYGKELSIPDFKAAETIGDVYKVVFG